MIDATRLRQILEYDPDTGIFLWLAPSKHHAEKVGKVAGVSTPSNGKFYVKISIDGKKYSRSRLAFLYMTGRWPTEFIDHINGNSLDDRWQNLREASATQNAWNHKTRKRSKDLPMGVRQDVRGKYVARIGHNKTLITIGTFDTVQAAQDAYQNERSVRYGKFA
jgi:hypothetical protein